MTEYIIESGMAFVADNIYHIEKSAAFSQVGSGVKTVELVRKIEDRLWFVEAKSYFPGEEETGKRGEWIRAVCDKFLHSLNLYCAVRLQIIVDTLPSEFDNCGVLFVLVIKEQTREKCNKIQEVLNMKMLPYLKIWKTKVIVINEDDAKQYHLVKKD